MVSTVWPGQVSDISTDTGLIVAPDTYAEWPVRPTPLTAEEIQLAAYQDQIGSAQREQYDLFRDYYEGRQRDPRTLTFDRHDTSRDRTFTARHNVCAPLVDVFMERLTVERFSVTVGDGRAMDAATVVAKQLWQWWPLARMDALARVVHHAAFRYGDAYLTVGWDDGRGTPRYSIEDTRQVRPVYDTRHQLAVVYKCWEETTGIGPAARTWLRINKYQPGLIEKFVGAASGTRMDYYDGDGDGGVILWVDRSGEPLPIPIVHFRNLPRGSDYGRSELADVVPEQDEFNRRTWATGQAAVFDGARIKFGLNVQPMTDPDTGEPKAPPMGPNVFWYMNPLDPEKPAELATLDSGDLGQLQEVADRQLKTIAGLAGIPIHLIWPGGGLPSGESLKVAESRLVAKLHDRTVSFGNDWEDTQYLALKLAETFGRISVPEGVQLTTEWASIETRSALTDEQVIDLRKDDLSWRQRMRERGYTEDEIALIEAEREADRETAVGDAAQMAEATTEMKEPEPEPHAAADPARSR